MCLLRSHQVQRTRNRGQFELPLSSEDRSLFHPHVTLCTQHRQPGLVLLTRDRGVLGRPLLPSFPLQPVALPIGLLGMPLGFRLQLSSPGDRILHRHTRELLGRGEHRHRHHARDHRANNRLPRLSRRVAVREGVGGVRHDRQAREHPEHQPRQPRPLPSGLVDQHRSGVHEDAGIDERRD